MTFICIWSPDWAGASSLLDRLAATALRVIPRVALSPEKGQIWGDGQSLENEQISSYLLTELRQQGNTNAQVGVAIVPIAAEIAARYGNDNAASRQSITTVVPGDDRDFLSRHLVAVLAPSPHLATLFDGVGIESCGDLARLDQESVEVRFGAEGVHLWRLSRADDRRMIFSPMLRSLPEASLDWVDYSLTDPERLVFVINALVDNVSGALASRGLCAREMTLVFSLANRSSYEHLVRPSRSTSSRKAWMRLIRTHLDRIVLADAVTGIQLRVESVTGEAERQGDIFDRGFATARATEETVAQLLDDQGAVIVMPTNSRHPLIERRTTWTSMEPAYAARVHMAREVSGGPVGSGRDGGGRYGGGRERGGGGGGGGGGAATISSRASADPRLTLQLLAEPKRIIVRTSKRRDHELPVRYRDSGAWVPLESAAGPDRISGGQWGGEGEETYAREYFRCVTEEGKLVWIFREARSNEWYMHGWWD